jgi:NTP pyrophosphatase (non-canonical NTP hydrolase)
MKELIEGIHETAVEKGFWDFLLELDGMLRNKELTVPEYKELAFIFYGKQLMMLSSEVSEVMEAIRKEKGSDEIEAEFADIFIRMADLYQGLFDRGLILRPLEEAIELKTGVNEKRVRMHGVLG